MHPRNDVDSKATSGGGLDSGLDAVDRRLLSRLMRDGRASWADLAHDLQLTAPAIAQRVRRLQDRGVIRQFAAWVEPQIVAPVCAYVTVRFTGPDQRDAFHERIVGLDAVQECNHLAGVDDYLLKVRCGSLEELRVLVSDTLPRIPGVTRARASVVLSTIKDTPVLPVPLV
jgi:Lrp/AsnC family leucine-responsive transcriptional regulator